jgi:hypothetical protein
MEIKNIQTVSFGSGKDIFEAYLTLDLIPFHLIVKYDKIKTDINFGFGGMGAVYSSPKYIDKFYTIEVYQEMVNALCEKFDLEKREVFAVKRNGYIPIFDFKKDTYCYEFQYIGGFSMTIYTLTNCKNVLKSYEQYSKLLDDNKDDFRNDSFCNISIQIRDVIKHFRKQKLFTNRDYFELSSPTLDKFIQNFQSKAKQQA